MPNEELRCYYDAIRMAEPDRGKKAVMLNVLPYKFRSVTSNRRY